MYKSILAASLLALTAAAPALAQTAEPRTEPPAKVERSEPTTTQPSNPSYEMKAGSPRDSAASETHAKRNMASHDPNWRASKLIGGSIVNAANESIGDVNDLLISPDGKIASVIVGVGGFLGIGEKDVALSFDTLSLTKDNNGNTVIMSKATKASLESMPPWTAPSKM